MKKEEKKRAKREAEKQQGERERKSERNVNNLKVISQWLIITTFEVFNHKILCSGLERTESSEDELDESTVVDSVKEEKGELQEVLSFITVTWTAIKVTQELGRL